MFNALNWLRGKHAKNAHTQRDEDSDSIVSNLWAHELAPRFKLSKSA